tara:strand:+ start:1138 stop:2163 length:1026 start_codon:yes stop_codon:yes gene_type:complete
MINVKISLPGEKSDCSFENFIDPTSKRLRNIAFHINNNIKEADYWFIFEDLYKSQENCIVAKENIIYLNTETSFPSTYFFEKHMKSYLKQFNYLYGCYETFNPKYINTLPFLPWMINYKSNDSIFSTFGDSVDGLRSLKPPKKKKKISVVCSDKTNTEDHKLRYEFTKNLKSYFGDELDWYGTGVNPIENKWKGIQDYKYHIVIENKSKNNLISEKLFDSYLGFAFPLYYGAPNIADYFSSESFQEIDINNFNEAIDKIQKVIDGNLYEKKIEKIKESRNLVLGKYNFLNRVSEIINKVEFQEHNSSKSKITLYSVKEYWNQNTSLKKKAKHTISRKLRLY